ncbi:hypothetical protein BJ980_000750 [Nocardioides daedukensis]|uniref:Uncharacterized protein n=1 Tax=Nocardioides daedukensis TaxID=634462 RepID=A0A7Y9RZT3_9ACTN|nr:hypothetical protein [Nocardioides daedukensis]NYG57827.1 hypothetical protein [Nocardioides daedukensis]
MLEVDDEQGDSSSREEQECRKVCRETDGRGDTCEDRAGGQFSVSLGEAKIIN